ncbi:MAG TPA: hypothetical protein VFU79_08640 [Nitrososphaeraceae archaeon]|nr:hypothetical protein [Nitrososphaeraceae archaeon]
MLIYTGIGMQFCNSRKGGDEQLYDSPKTRNISRWWLHRFNFSPKL